MAKSFQVEIVSGQDGKVRSSKGSDAAHLTGTQNAAKQNIRAGGDATSSDWVRTRER